MYENLKLGNLKKPYGYVEKILKKFGRIFQIGKLSNIFRKYL